MALMGFYIYLLMFMSAMLGLVLNDNVLMLYLFWELTSISSFLLIAFWFMKERSLYGAQKSMLITMGGGFLMLGGFRAHPVRRLHQIGTVPILHLAAGCNGSTYTGKCLPPLRHHGKGSWKQ